MIFNLTYKIFRLFIYKKYITVTALIIPFSKFTSTFRAKHKITSFL